MPTVNGVQSGKLHQFVSEQIQDSKDHEETHDPVCRFAIEGCNGIQYICNAILNNKPNGQFAQR